MEADGTFCVEVSVNLRNETGSELAERIQHWWTDVWTPNNKVWLRVWKTGADRTIERPEDLKYDESFFAPPAVVSCSASELKFRLLGKGSSKLWKDWLVWRIMPDLKAMFRQVGDLRSIRDCQE